MATFKVVSTFHITNRGFALIGEVLEGSISAGDYVSLTKDNRTVKIRIIGLQVVDIINRQSGYVGLVFSAEDEEILKYFTMEGIELQTLPQ